MHDNSSQPEATNTMNVWRMFTHHIDPDKAIAWSRKNDRIAIGWGRVGDATDYQSQSEIKAAIRDRYPIPHFRNNAHLGAPSLWDFCHTMQHGDLVILSGRTPRTVVVEVNGDYEYVEGESPLEGDYRNQRSVRFTDIDPNKLWFAAGQAPGKTVYQTLIQCAHAVNLSEI